MLYSVRSFPSSYSFSGWLLFKTVMWHHLYCVFTNIHPLLINKHLSECLNFSSFSVYFHFSVRVIHFYSYFLSLSSYVLITFSTKNLDIFFVGNFFFSLNTKIKQNLGNHHADHGILMLAGWYFRFFWISEISSYLADAGTQWTCVKKLIK